MPVNLKPSGDQLALETLLPGAPDKTYVVRELRSNGTWTLTRLPDGTPRE